MIVYYLNNPVMSRIGKEVTIEVSSSISIMRFETLMMYFSPSGTAIC